MRFLFTGILICIVLSCALEDKSNGHGIIATCKRAFVFVLLELRTGRYCQLEA